MAAQNEKEMDAFGVILAGALAWVVPGSGYWVLGDRRRAMVAGITIVLTFALGLYIGSIGVVDSTNARYWYAAQIMTSPAVLLLGPIVAHGDYMVFHRPFEIGQIYTSIAGLLNLLCIINVVYLAHLRRQASRGGLA